MRITTSGLEHRLGLGLGLGLLLVSVSLPAAEPADVVRVGPLEAVERLEVSVALDPVKPGRVVAVAMELGHPTKNVAFVSSDGGASWRRVEGPNPDRRTQGDDAVRFSADGRAFWSYISFRGLHQSRPEKPASGIFVNRSEDGGETWFRSAPVVDHPKSLAPFEDKPALAVDGRRVYLAWTRFSRYGSRDPRETSNIFFAFSEDGGETFAPPLRVSDEPGDATDGDGTVEGVVPAVGVGGEVYLVWSGPKGMIFDRSLDHGRTFGRDRRLFAHPGGWDVEIDGLTRANGLPVTGVDRGEGPFRGTLYLNWVDDRNGDPDVFVSSSRDGGGSWSAPVRVNDDPVGNGAAQFFTWMAVDPVDGSVNVVFYDRRDLAGTETAVTVARSTDGGGSFVNQRVAVDPFRMGADVFLGDYIGIDALGGRVVAVFPLLTSEHRVALFAARFEHDTVNRRPGPVQAH